ncbi:Sodium/hydrogen exchanger [Armillaria solidipes]|uniref:Sodium/hydrogen exchanger n=1 Tax=Armillaria solidipes TaxID=1076256 RepID=A0A2H3C673_9AGAR|nr:Sodium/hydrogen exchanger [Armillaria solidipes]
MVFIESSELLNISAQSLAYIVLGGFVVAFSTVSVLAKDKFFVNEVVLGTAFGVAVGPYGCGIFDPHSWGSSTQTVTLEVMRIVLAIGLFIIGVELPGPYMARHAKGLLFMVVPTMAIGWVTVAGVLRALFPGLNFVSCLAVAACLTPTDPIICAAIVGGKFAVKHVPLNLRQILSAESAANDGLAYPFLSISIYLTVESSKRVAFEKWLIIGCLYQVIMGVVIGAVLGLAFSWLMKRSLRRGFIDRESYVAQYLALAFLTIGIVSTIGSDDLLAAFAAGNALSWDEHFNSQTEDELFATVIDRVLNCACFVYIGAWLRFDTFNDPSLGISLIRLTVFFIAILVLRRIPSILLLYKWIPEISSWQEALFSGHFVGAVFISTLALTRLPEPRYPPETQQELLATTLQPIVSFVVLGSIIIHGLSIPFFSMGRNVSRTLSRSTRDVPEWMFWINQRGAVYKDEEKSRKPDLDLEERLEYESRAEIVPASGGSSTPRVVHSPEAQ